MWRQRYPRIGVGVKKVLESWTSTLFGGADGTRTRDPMRDRHVF